MKVIIGLSGGVDSSVAALLLLKQGHDVEGLFMKNWDEDDTAHYCNAKDDLANAEQVAKKLNIKLHKINFATEYWQQVWQYFIDEHKIGRTPNPDIVCNEKIKFKVFLDYALSLGANKIATGHYASIVADNNKFYLKTAKDEKKDQTYFLYRLNNYQLSKSLFPLANLRKTTVRKIAKENGLVTASAKDSMGICFIGKRKFNLFLSKYIAEKKGDIYDYKGNFIKKHNGAHFFTIGQRKGLDIGGGFDNPTNAPWFVVDKDIVHNKIIVAPGDNKLLYHNGAIVEKLHMINEFDITKTYQARIRHQGSLVTCTIHKENYCKFKVIFNDKIRAIVPGQSIVFYYDNFCCGGAIIVDRFNIKYN